MEVEMKKIRLVFMIGVLGLFILSCSLFSMQRTADGALRVETNLPLQVITNILSSASEMTNVVNMQVELRDGYIYVHADSVQFQNQIATNVSFHIELTEINGLLAAQITNLDMSGNMIDESAIESYNQMLTEELTKAGQQVDQAKLENVSVSPDGIKMVWLLGANGSN
jgi:uncharacterized membrane protein